MKIIALTVNLNEEGGIRDWHQTVIRIARVGSHLMSGDVCKF